MFKLYAKKNVTPRKHSSEVRAGITKSVSLSVGAGRVIFGQTLSCDESAVVLTSFRILIQILQGLEADEQEGVAKLKRMLPSYCSCAHLLICIRRTE